ncbi:MAG: HAD family hydrolase [Bacteroidota bacterium]
MTYSCIIFDCDGVLVDSEEISMRVLTDMASSLGAEIHLEYAVEHLAGKSFSQVLAHVDSLIPTDLPDHFERTFRQRTFDAFKTDLQPIQGIQQFIDKLDIPYCVASNGPIDKIRLNLTTVGLMDRFEGRIFSAYQIGKWKPDPALFEFAASSMGVLPKECAVIEDSLSGIVAAKRGGFDVFGFAKPFNRASFEQEGAIPFGDIEELYDLFYLC